MAGRPALTQLLVRLKQHLARELEYHVVCRALAFSEAVGTAAACAGASLFDSDAPSVRHALLAFQQAHPHIESWLLFSEFAILPDCTLTAALLEDHWRSEAMMTVGPEHPLDLTPVIMRASMIARLLDERTVDEAPGDWLGSLVTLARRQTTIGLPPDAAMRSLARDKTAWPHRVRVFDHVTQDAATSALEQYGHCPGSEPAYAFKRALLSRQQRAPRFQEARAIGNNDALGVLFSSLQLGFSGGEESLSTLILNLDRRRFAPVGVFSVVTRLQERLDAARVPTEVAGWDYSPLTRANLQYCDALLERYRPAIVHVDGYENPALMAAAWARGIPIVGHLRLYPDALVPSSVFLADRMITVSEGVATELRRQNIEPERVIAIHNAVDLTRFDRQRFDRQALRRDAGIDQNALVVSLVSRITRDKRPHLLLEALASLRAAHPSIQLVIVGEPDVRDLGYVDELRRAIAARGLEPHVRWWGFEPDIARIYAMSDVLALCSRREAFGRCIAEAMAMGLAVVAPDGSGPAEQIEHGVSGLLFDPDSLGALTEALAHVLSNVALRDSLSQHAPERARRFSVTRHVSAVQDVYDDLLATHGRTHDAR